MSDHHRYVIAEIPDREFYGDREGRLREEFADLFGRPPDVADEELGLAELIHVARIFEARGWA